VVGASRWTPRAARAMQRRWASFKRSHRTFPAGRTPRSRIFTPSEDAESELIELSPDYTFGEIGHIWEGNEFSERYLLTEVLSLDLTEIRRLNCPLIIFAGRHDVNINSEVAAAWFAKVDAPSKQFLWFENSAHLPMTEEPGKFLISLVRYARPIAEKARDGPPTDEISKR
jgi:proline iminopeptidase